MNVLGLETSTRTGSVAILNEEDILGEMTVEGHGSHSTWVLPAVRSLCEATRTAISDIDGIAVGIGPGSFTGLRIGLATAKGLALSLHKPLVGVSSLEALALNIWLTPYDICPMFDARKGEVYAGVYRYGKLGKMIRIRKDSVMRPERLLKSMPGRKTIFLGDGARVYKTSIRKALGDMASFAPAHLFHPRAGYVASLGLKRLKGGAGPPCGEAFARTGPPCGEAFARGCDDMITLEPRYLRLSEAELKTRISRSHRHHTSIPG